MTQKLRRLGDELFIRFFFFFLLVLCGASPESLWLPSVSKMWLTVQSVPCPAFCISLTNTRVGFSDINFELFTSTAVFQDLQEQNHFRFVVNVWALSETWSGGVFQTWPIPPGAAVRQWCLEPARKPRHVQSPNSWLIQIKRQRKLQPVPCDLTKLL